MAAKAPASGVTPETFGSETFEAGAAVESSRCPEWSRLVQQYRASVLAYSDAASALSRGPGPEFDQAWQRTEDARRSCEDSRAELWHHEQDHSCSRGAPKPAEPLEYIRRRLRALS